MSLGILCHYKTSYPPNVTPPPTSDLQFCVKLMALGKEREVFIGLAKLKSIITDDCNEEDLNDTTRAGGKRRRACGECEACRREDCGECRCCKDKKKFGGPGTMKKKCIERVCPHMV